MGKLLSLNKIYHQHILVCAVFLQTLLKSRSNSKDKLQNESSCKIPILAFKPFPVQLPSKSSHAVCSNYLSILEENGAKLSTLPIFKVT